MRDVSASCFCNKTHKPARQTKSTKHKRYKKAKHSHGQRSQTHTLNTFTYVPKTKQNKHKTATDTGGHLLYLWRLDLQSHSVSSMSPQMSGLPRTTRWSVLSWATTNNPCFHFVSICKFAVVTVWGTPGPPNSQNCLPHIELFVPGPPNCLAPVHD